MTREEILNDIAAAVKRMGYSADEYDSFSAEYGWQPWMESYTHAGERFDGIVSAQEAAVIDALVAEGFKLAFKERRGGARPGAGRKKGSVKEGATGRKKIFYTVSISGTPEEIAKLKANAAAADQTVSRFVISRLAD